MSKDECPICFKDVNNNIDCFECMTCKQKMHALCAYEWCNTKYQQHELLSDDIVICPTCRGDSIEACYNPGVDVNQEMKQAVAVNPNRRGGKIRKSRKSRRKSRKSRRKSRKSRRK
jgi:hypothetical protein